MLKSRQEGLINKTVSFSLILLIGVLNLTPIFAGQRTSRQTVKPNSFRPDAGKLAAQNGGNSLWRININSPNDKSKIERAATIIEDYGSFIVAAAPSEKELKRISETERIETELCLPGGKFEPLSDVSVQRSLGKDFANVNSAEKDYYLVQFAAPVRDKWLTELRETGAEIIQYVPHNGFFVYADAEQISRISNHYRVRWTGRFLPDDKLSPILTAQIAQTRGASLDSAVSPLEITERGTSTFDVAVFARAELETVKNQILTEFPAQIKGVSRLPNNYFNVIRLEMPVDKISELAKLKEVIQIDAYIRPQAEDERAAQIVAGNYTSRTVLAAPGYNPLAQFGVSGQNVTVSVVDDGVAIPGAGGFYITANNTINAPLRNAAAGATGGHGHINASIIAGNAPFGGLDPTGYNYGIGIAPGANILNIPLLVSGYNGTEADSVNDTVSTAGPNGVKGTITNNSWGNGTNNNSYDSFAAQYDGFAQDASQAATIDPILVVFSAGNSGTSGLTRPKMSKNTIAVANSENIRTELLQSGADNMDDLRSTSSRGIAADGRIKPDITAPGTAISGSRAGNGSSVSGFIDANHSYSSGTSHAAPQIAGAAALFTEFWKNDHNWQNPSPALIKAALLNSPVEMNGVSTSNPIPNGDEGWGRIHLKNVFNTGVPIQYVNQTTEFSDVGQSATISGTIASAAKPVRVSLVWTDPPGVSNPALVNNLDLTVTIGDNVYKGNVFSNGVSVTGGTASTRDNVEQVFLPAGIAAGTPISVQVAAAGLNGNGILGNSDQTDQHFALVIYNANTSTAPQRKQPADFDGDGKTDYSVFRPSIGTWFFQRSQNNQFGAFQFGTPEDRIVPADYDGDFKTDFGVYRNGTWYLQKSSAGFSAVNFGLSTDIPLPADFDGDGKADLAVFRPSTGNWFYLKSSDGSFAAAQFGQNGDKPVIADFDGDNKADLTVYRPSTGNWFYLRSSDNGFRAFQFGAFEDKPVAEDYDGDGKFDLAVFRPSTGHWFILRSSDNQFATRQWGASGDQLTPGDFDGDGKTDIAVFRPADGNWYVLRSSNGQLQAAQFGANGDLAVPAPFSAN